MHPAECFHPPEYYIPFILQTWKNKGIKPKFHVSEQGSGRTGHHSDFIEKIPNYLLEIPKKYKKGWIIKHHYKTKNSRYDLRIGKNGDEILIKDIVDFGKENIVYHFNKTIKGL